jgi:hypothetical protein
MAVDKPCAMVASLEPLLITCTRSLGGLRVDLRSMLRVIVTVQKFEKFVFVNSGVWRQRNVMVGEQ